MTSSTKLATALLFFGHTLRRPPCTRQVRKDGRTIVTFLFNPSTPGVSESCGKFAVRWMELEQQDPGDDTPEKLRERVSWLATLRASGEPIASAYALTGWRDISLSIVKATPRMVEITASEGFGFIREDATPSEIQKLQRNL